MFSISEAEYMSRESVMADMFGNGWEAIVAAGESPDRFVSVADFPIYDDSADLSLASDDDWSWWLEATFSGE